MTEQEIKKILNQVLKDLFFKILRLQEEWVSQASNDNISRTEMHALEIIQDKPGATLTNIAQALGITKATASVTVTRLAEKNYLTKAKVKNDKRKSTLILTERGIKCYDIHEQFHNKMVESVLDEFNIKEYPSVLKSLQSLLDFFNHLNINRK